MRTIALAATGAIAILMAGSTASRTEAMPLGATLRPAIEAINPVEKASICWRWGWHGWGWYPCGYWAPRPYWGPRVFYGPRPFWGPHFRRWWR